MKINKGSILKNLIIVLAVISIIGIPLVILWFYFRKLEKGIEISPKKKNITEKMLLKDRLRELESSQNWSDVIALVIIFVLAISFVYVPTYFWFFFLPIVVIIGIPMAILRYMRDKEINEIRIKLIEKKKR